MPACSPSSVGRSRWSTTSDELMGCGPASKPLRSRHVPNTGTYHTTGSSLDHQSGLCARRQDPLLITSMGLRTFRAIPRGAGLPVITRTRCTPTVPRRTQNSVQAPTRRSAHAPNAASHSSLASLASPVLLHAFLAHAPLTRTTQQVCSAASKDANFTAEYLSRQFYTHRVRGPDAWRDVTCWLTP